MVMGSTAFATHSVIVVIQGEKEEERRKKRVVETSVVVGMVGAMFSTFWQSTMCSAEKQMVCGSLRHTISSHSRGPCRNNK